MLSLQELKSMSDKELNEELVKAKKLMMELTMKKTLGQLKETHLITQTKQIIARIKTLQTQYEGVERAQ
jgi:large subunit ribosomal protein L29